MTTLLLLLLLLLLVEEFSMLTYPWPIVSFSKTIAVRLVHLNALF